MDGVVAVRNRDILSCLMNVGAREGNEGGEEELRFQNSLGNVDEAAYP